MAGLTQIGQVPGGTTPPIRRLLDHLINTPDLWITGGTLSVQTSGDRIGKIDLNTEGATAGQVLTLNMAKEPKWQDVSGTGTVTSVAVNVSDGIQLSGGTDPVTITTMGTISLGLGTVGVANGGTGATSLTEGGVLLGSGTGAITAMGVLANGEMIVGGDSGDPVAESGDTLRTSIGLGMDDGVTFSDVTVSSAIATVASSGANQTGNSLTISAGQGTGDESGGSIIFQTAPAGDSGESVNDLVTALTINAAGLVTAAAGFAGSGASLNSLNGSNISTGTIAKERVATLDQDTTGNAATATTAATATKVTVTDSDADTNFPVLFHNEATGAIHDDTGALRYNPNTGTCLVPILSAGATNVTGSTITMADSGDTATFTIGEHGALTLETVDAGGSEADININADGAVDIAAIGISLDATNDDLELSSFTGIDISTTTGTLDINANAMDMDLTDSSSITLTSSEAGEDLTIEQVGGNDSSIIIQAAGTGSDAIKLNATAGSIDICSNGNITLDADGGTVVTGDVTMYEAVNDGNPELRIGSADAEEAHIQAVYDSGAQTLNHLLVSTDTADTGANAGLVRFNVDGTDIVDIDDGGLNFAANKGISINGADIVTDSGGTATLSNIDAIDATTEMTLEVAIDSLTNLTAVGTLTTGTWNATAIAVANGGTGQTSYANGELLIGNGSTLTKATLTGTANQITVSNGTGSIELSGPQDIHTGASPTFAGANLDGAVTINDTGADVDFRVETDSNEHAISTSAGNDRVGILTDPSVTTGPAQVRGDLTLFSPPQTASEYGFGLDKMFTGTTNITQAGCVLLCTAAPTGDYDGQSFGIFLTAKKTGSNSLTLGDEDNIGNKSLVGGQFFAQDSSTGGTIDELAAAVFVCSAPGSGTITHMKSCSIGNSSLALATKQWAIWQWSGNGTTGDRNYFAAYSGFGEDQPEEQVHIGQGENLLIDTNGSILINEDTTANGPSSPEQDSQGRIYLRNDKLVVQFNDGGAEKWWYLDLSSTTDQSWTYATTEP